MQAIDDATGDDDGQIMDHKLTSWRRRLPLSTCLHLHPLNFFIFNLFFNFILKITHPDIYLQI